LEVEKSLRNPIPQKEARKGPEKPKIAFFSPFSASASLGLNENQSRMDETTREIIKMDKSKASMPTSAAIMSKVTTPMLKACKDFSSVLRLCATEDSDAHQSPNDVYYLEVSFCQHIPLNAERKTTSATVVIS
jgi:hypothetical protein